MEDFPAFRVTAEHLSFLSTEWDLVSSRYGAGEAAREGVRDSLFSQYSAAARFYHNLRHVAELLRLVNSYGGPVQDDESVRFAVWFHDVIYDTRRNDNEERSAEFAGAALRRLRTPPEVVERTSELVLATKKHQARDPDSDAGVFLDADLSVLGAPEQVYLEYSRAIRLEYEWVPAPLYREKRKEVLESFLSRERIYFTEGMRARFEAQARRNLAREIQALGPAHSRPSQ